MLLVVDVGNTQTHLGTFDGEELVEHWRFATVRTSTADELGAALRNLLALRGMSFADIHASIVSSTVPQLRPEWTSMAARYLGHAMPVVGPGVRTGMPIRYDNPREIGPDRPVRDRRLRHRGHARHRLGRGRVPGRRDLPGRGDLARGVV
jgi:type III pantothenate kinase